MWRKNSRVVAVSGGEPSEPTPTRVAKIVGIHVMQISNGEIMKKETAPTHWTRPRKIPIDHDISAYAIMSGS